MAKGKSIKCAYAECMLPDSNAKYFIQAFYLTISILFLFRSSTDFTFFAILMYSAPILLDLTYSGMKGLFFVTIKYIFIAFNGIILTFCFLGLFGVIVDTGDSFKVVETALMLASATIDKKQLVVPMLLELLVPVSMLIGSPTKNAKKAIEFVLREEEK